MRREQEELATFDKAFELATHLSEVMSQALAERGLNTARAEVLYVLHGQGPLVQRQLAQALHCTPRHVTTLVDTLQAAGLVARTPHPTDRRATLVTMTGPGEELAGQLDQARRNAARAVLGDFSAEQLAGFVAVADRIIERVAPTAAGQPEAG